MEKAKALEIIQALINEAIKKGVMGDIQTAVLVAQAYETLAKENE